MDSLETLAFAEIDEYREQLVPGKLVELQIQRLAADLRELGREGGSEFHAAVVRTAAYLRRTEQWTDVDPRLRLDCVCTLCWTKREEALEAIPESMRESVNEDWADVDDLMAFWEAHRHSIGEAALARMLSWWALANLVSNAVHLSEGEAEEMLLPLLVAFKDVSQGLSELN